jgi:L-ascorbate metabolism protein UlaG (beta-lactamase superfamily)
MIEPVRSDDRLLSDIAAGKHDEGFRLWWLGQSGFLVQWNERHLLFDPYLSESLTKKYAETDKPHVRMTRCPVAPQRLGFIDVVTSSHNHTDHLDAETLIPLMENNPQMQIVVPSANQEFAAQRLGVSTERLIPIDAGQTREVSDFSLHGIPAAHEQVERDAQGRCRFLGYVARFGEWTVYHSGDTVRYDELAEHLLPWQVDVALLPINGSRPERRVAGNLWGREAAQLGRDIRARVVIPCHFEMFEFNTVTPDEFIAEATRLQQPYSVLRCGQRWSSEQLGE